MPAIASAVADFVEAARRFSRPARHYLASEFLLWTGHGVFAVVFNLYLVESGFSEGFVGQAVALNGIGLAAAALPAGLLAERWGRRRTLILGVVLEALGYALRASTVQPGPVLGSSLVIGAGQSFFQIAAAPFLTEHSGTRERTHLFSTFFAAALLAGVLGSVVGGAIPDLLRRVAPEVGLFAAYRVALWAGALLAIGAVVPLLRLRGLAESATRVHAVRLPREAVRSLTPLAFNALLIGMGAGLVIPFMNLYFKDRFDCSSARIGAIFAAAQVMTAAASLAGPALARRFGMLRTAVASQLLSLPFLVTLGAESHLSIAVLSFWMRATLMQASTPLVQTFVMEALPAELRARSTSLNNLVWNIGWAVSATLAGTVIERFGYAVPFYVTAVLYGVAAVTFYRAFRGRPAAGTEVRLSEEAKGLRGDGPASE